MRTPFGYSAAIPDEREITQSHDPVPAPSPPPADPRPPAALDRDVWPWLALLGLLAVAGVLVWLFVFRADSAKGKVVPAVVGMRQQQAIKKLTDDGFGVRAIIGPAAKPRGIVVSQAPGAGARLGKGQAVTLHISNGRPLEVVTQTTQVTTTQATTVTTTAAAATAPVPDVTGQNMKDAAGQVEAAGFVPETRPDTSATGTPGTVVGESPAAGTAAKVGSVVVLSVATGSSPTQVQVPNVVGEKAAAARAALLDAKLTVKTAYKHGPASSIGVVLAQTPTGAAPAYTQVTITVGS